MNVMLVILFAVTIIYLSITERFRTFANLIGAQGVNSVPSCIYRTQYTDSGKSFICSIRNPYL